ncbi:hypothetical protein RSAG8_05207, partial [Rhizoctonia solani AG-8 WAC10335]
MIEEMGVGTFPNEVNLQCHKLRIHLCYIRHLSIRAAQSHHPRSPVELPGSIISRLPPCLNSLMLITREQAKRIAMLVTTPKPLLSATSSELPARVAVGRCRNFQFRGFQGTARRVTATG